MSLCFKYFTTETHFPNTVSLWGEEWIAWFSFHFHFENTVFIFFFQTSTEVQIFTKPVQKRKIASKLNFFKATSVRIYRAAAEEGSSSPSSEGYGGLRAQGECTRSQMNTGAAAFCWRCWGASKSHAASPAASSVLSRRDKETRRFSLQESDKGCPHTCSPHGGTGCPFPKGGQSPWYPGPTVSWWSHSPAGRERTVHRWA